MPNVKRLCLYRPREFSKRVYSRILEIINRSQSLNAGMAKTLAFLALNGSLNVIVHVGGELWSAGYGV